ncbi:MAG: hypothetical protein QXE81_06190 [Desulfurococcaceae archaeon]
MTSLDIFIQRGLKVTKATIGLFSNNPSFVFNQEYFEGIKHHSVLEGEGWEIQSQWANFNLEFVNPIETSTYDGLFIIIDTDIQPPLISIDKDNVVAVGEWSRLEKQVSDKRYTLLGNQGLLFRFVLTVLERKYGIYSFHASGLYNEETNELLLALGERGSGKSALMLSALEKGLYKLLAGEILHAEISGDDLIFYRGSPRNNVRAGHLIYDFPALMKKIGVRFRDLADPWGTKVQVDLQKFMTKYEQIVNPQIILVIPRIEEHNKYCKFSYIDNKDKLKRALTENISDKLRSLPLIYDTVPVGVIDDLELTTKRYEFVKRFLEKANIKKAVSLFAGPHNCFDGWL